MEDRLASDETKLREAVGFFRTNANLHASSSDEALIRYAHEGGTRKPHASMVRDCWHDFEHGRRYEDLPVIPYQIKYQTQEQMFDEPADVEQALAALDRATPRTETVRDDRLSTSRHEGADEADAKEAKAASEGASDDPAPSCLHIDTVLDETGRENLCADCGELLGPASPNSHSNLEDADGSDEGKGKVATSDASGTASGPKRAERSKQRPPDDEEEVLF